MAGISVSIQLVGSSLSDPDWVRAIPKCTSVRAYLLFTGARYPESYSDGTGRNRTGVLVSTLPIDAFQSLIHPAVTAIRCGPRFFLNPLNFALKLVHFSN